MAEYGKGPLVLLQRFFNTSYPKRKKFIKRARHGATVSNLP
ncbi:hypothetical protein HMPREF9554_00058 [Treponema phagedenis F0421]|nr:hypothetical protein HMPREF9554_00058 [Treponema phagedenis F0421]